MNVLGQKKWFYLKYFFCRISGHNSEASSFSCAVTCDVEVKANSTMNVETGRGTISVHVDPDGSLNCTAKQMFDGHHTFNSTERPSDAFNNSTGSSFCSLLLRNSWAQWSISVLFFFFFNRFPHGARISVAGDLWSVSRPHIAYFNVNFHLLQKKITSR